MTRVWAGEIAADVMLSEGVECMFGLTGGHLQSIQDFAYRAGIDVYQVRHEQAGVYAADAYARTARRPGVCFGTAGPGMLNMAAGLHMAYLAKSPVVALLGGHKSAESDRGSLQEADARGVLSSITKWTRRCHTPEQVSFYIRKAFRDAMTPPHGPVAIEFPLDVMSWAPVEREDQVSHVPGRWRVGRAPRLYPDPELMTEVTELVRQSERPLIIAGDGTHWDRADANLTDIVQRLQVPISLRRSARGAVNENLAITVPAAVRKPLISDADLIILLGLEVGYFESFGSWRTNAEFVQVARDPGLIATQLPTRVELQADIHSFLAVLASADSGDGLGAAQRAEWVQRVTSARRDAEQELERAAADYADQRPIHPGAIARSLARVVPPGAPVVLDSFTGSAFLSGELKATRSGQVIDSGLSAAVGHGIGMGIGASVATQNGPAVVFMGDGGMGVGSGDIETAARLGLPVVYVIYNDSAFCAGLEQYCYGKDFRVLGEKARGGFNLTKDVRYDLMAAPLGCHVENVVDPDQLDPAIQRSLASGKTAVVNVIGTRDVAHPLYDSAYSKEMFWHLPSTEIEAPARRQHLERYYPQFHGGEQPIR